MKKFRKIMAVLVAAMMIMAMCVPAWADKGRLDGISDDGTTAMAKTGNITINNAEDGETYSIYKIFDLYSFKDDEPGTESHAATERYSYMIEYSENASSWYYFINTYYADDRSAPGTGASYFKIDRNNPVYFDANFHTVASDADGAKQYFFVKGVGDFDTITTPTVDEKDRAESIAAGAKVQDFAKKALSWAKGTNPFTNEATGGTIAATETKTAVRESDDNQVVFTGKSLGWYLVESSIGTLVGLDTNNLNVIITEKNDIPQIDKMVMSRTATARERNGSNKYATNTWVRNTNYEIGSVVPFLITITIPKGANSTYKVHDVLEKGFTLNTDSFKFYKTTGEITEPITQNNANNLVLTTDTSQLTDGCDFEVGFVQTYLDDLADGDKIEIEYTAVLNADAYVFGSVAEANSGDPTKIYGASATIEGAHQDPQGIGQIYTEHNADSKNTNSAILTFGVKSGRGDVAEQNLASTKWAVATVDTYRFDLAKTEEANPADTYPLLSGAIFRLFDDVSKVGTDSNAMDLAATNNEYRPKVSDDAITTKDITTDANNGAIILKGLKAGTYYLKETKAPTGYDKIDGYFAITITGDVETNNGVHPAYGNSSNYGKFSYAYTNGSGSAVASMAATNLLSEAKISDKKYSTAESVTNQGGLHIINKSGAELPSTGGMGTTVLYIVGGMLVILAGAYLFFSRKRTA